MEVRLASRSGHFISDETAADTHWISSWAGSKTGLTV